jgi:lathosterol oxidase
MVLFPLIAPVNVDMLFFQFAIFFYAYGCYLHWGFESNWPDAHHPWINTAYQHNLHHNKSIMNKPLHTGFMFKVWDQAFGTVYNGKCDCVKCLQEAGQRTREQFDKVEKPDYSVLLQPSFWSTQLKSGAWDLAPKVAIGAPLIWGLCFALQAHTVQGVEM